MDYDSVMATRIKGQLWTSKNIFVETTVQANKLGAINLGQGAATFEIPEFFFKAYKDNLNSSVNQHYCRNQGVNKFVEQVAKIYKGDFEHEIDGLTEVLAVPGGQSALAYACQAFCNPGEEIITIEPFFRMYLADFNMADSVSVGIKMTPNEEGIWQLDYEGLEQAVMSPKAKLLILNCPHNPSGKIFSYEEYSKIAEIVNKNPRVVVLSDEVYDRQVFDNNTFTRFANMPGMWDRTISMFSAGKLFSMTGIRMGWMVGHKQLIAACSRAHVSTMFCLYEPMQNAIAESLDIIYNQTEYKGFKNYYAWLSQQFQNNRDHFIRAFKNSSLNVKVYCPEGGYFMVIDVSNMKVDQRYYEDGKSHDEAVAQWFLIEKGLAMIPLKSFYIDQTTSPTHYLRLALCKDEAATIKASDIIASL